MTTDTTTPKQDDQCSHDIRARMTDGFNDYCGLCGNKLVEPVEPKQDGQTIDELDEAFSIYLGGQPDEDEYMDWLEFKQAIEAYCTERERLARIDEMERILAIEHEIWRLAGSGPGLDGEPLDAEVYATDRISELQKQSSSQEEK